MLRHLMGLVPPPGSQESHPHLLSLLIFPEGTDLSDSNIIKSNKYANQNGLEEMKYVLHPKSTGEY
jgi:hypothetical protein